MNNILKLLNNYFKMFFSKLFKNQNRKYATIFVTIITLVVGLIISFIFTLLSYFSIENALKINEPVIALYSLSTTALMFCCFIIVTECGITDKNKDEDFLLSLPIKKSNIIIAKILYYLIFDLVVILLLLLPSYAVYYFMVPNTSIILIVKAFILVILISLFANGVSGIISNILLKLTKKFKYSKIIQSIFNLIIMIIFAFVYLGFVLVSQNVEFSNQIYQFYPVQLITNFILNNNLFDYLVMILVSIIPFVISIILKAKALGKNILTYSSKKHGLLFEQSTPTRSLFIKEVNKYFSIPLYVTNTIMGSILAIVLAVVIFIVGKNHFVNLLEMIIASGYEGEMPTNIMPTIEKYFGLMLIITFALMISVSPTTSCSISLEGKEMWILKAHPIDYKDVFKSKIFINIIVTFIPVTIISLLLGFTIGGILEVLIIFILFEAIAINSSMLGLFANLLFPKLKWESEVEPIKQGLSVLVSMGINFLLVVIPLSIYFFFNINNLILFLLIIFGIYLLISLVISLILNTYGKKLYYQL